MRLVSVSEAGRILADGGLVIYPTETFLALGCAPDCAAAVKAIYKIKRRPGEKPLPLIAASLEEAQAQANLTACPAELLERFWPGPLNVILPAKTELPDFLLNQEHKLAMRVSASADASLLASLAGGLIAATSANLAGKLPCRQPVELGQAFLDACEASGLPWGIVKTENNCHYSAPSTLVEPVLDKDGWSLKIIREGAISRAVLAEAGWNLL